MVTLKNIWAQRLNSINKLKEILSHCRLFELKTVALLGTPDLLVYNTSGNFCTIELKVTKSKKLRFSVAVYSSGFPFWISYVYVSCKC